MKEMEIKTWYFLTFPDDNAVHMIKSGVTFERLYEKMKQGVEFGEILGENDSVLRERVFDKLAQLYSVRYVDIYQTWLQQKAFEIFPQSETPPTPPTPPKQTIWVGVIPEIFGYGISVVEVSEKACMKALKKEYKKWKMERPDPTTKFKTSFEAWGGRVIEVEIGKCYYDNFGE